MPTTFPTLIAAAQQFLTFDIGPVHFDPLTSVLLILAALVAAISALRLWQIGRRESVQERFEPLRGTRRAAALQAQIQAQAQAQAEARAPATMLARRRLPWYERLGVWLGARRVVGRGEQEKLLNELAAAGLRGRQMLPIFVLAKVVSSIVFIGLGWLALPLLAMVIGKLTEELFVRIAWEALAFLVGWQFPHVILTRLAAHRTMVLEQGIPDALDLMVICAEAGLSLDQAIEEVSRNLQASSPVVASEFEITAAEMRVAADRAQALENLALRTGLPSLRSLVSTLVQSIRFGTPLAESLRVIASELRAERAARFEERAARLPVLLTMPLMLMILPALFMVIGTPLVLRIYDVFRGLLGRNLGAL